MVQEFNLVVTSVEEVQKLIRNHSDKILEMIRKSILFYNRKYNSFFSQPDFADDMVQDITLYILDNAYKYDCIHNVHAFINGIVNQQILNALSKARTDLQNRRNFLNENINHFGQHHNQKLKMGPNVVFGAEKSVRSPFREAIANETYTNFFGSAGVEDFDKAVMKLHCEGGKNYVEIATELKCSIAKVNNVINDLGEKYAVRFE